MRRPGRSKAAAGGRPAQGGYVLLLLAALLVVTAIGLVVAALGEAEVQNRRNAVTAAALAQAKEALLGYALTYRDTHPTKVPGYLPCPDKDNDGSAESPCEAVDAHVIGRLPFKTLGQPDSRDADGECLWYAVSGSFKSEPMAASMNWDSAGRITVLDLAGNTLATADSASGAVAVIFAPGRPVRSQSRSAGSATCGGGSVNDFMNYLDGRYDAASDLYSDYTSPSSGNMVVTAGAHGGESPASRPRNLFRSEHNDQLLWVTSAEIFQRIKRRSDFAPQINTLIKDKVADCLRDAIDEAIKDGVALDPKYRPVATAGDPPAVGTRLLGTIPPSAACLDSADAFKAYWDKWRDQFRYVLCDSLTSPATVTAPPCLSEGAAPPSCYGVVIFGGERAGAQSRNSAAERGVAANYVEGINADLFDPAKPPPAGMSFSGSASFAITDPLAPASQDVVACLKP